ncbi:MAG: response regulator transcription factor [Sutterella wadsworthensis]
MHDPAKIDKPLIRVIDDDDAMRNSWAFLIEGEGWDSVKTYADAITFLSSNDYIRPGCLLLDVRMPHMSGLELQLKLGKPAATCRSSSFPATATSTWPSTHLKAGAIDFLQKPVDDQRLLKTIENAVSHNLAQRRGKREVTDFRNRLESLTQREREVIRMVAQGYSNKEVAREYGISEKTVQVHRGSAYRKLDLHNAAEIARLLMLTGDPL